MTAKTKLVVFVLIHSWCGQTNVLSEWFVYHLDDVINHIHDADFAWCVCVCVCVYWERERE